MNGRLAHRNRMRGIAAILALCGAGASAPALAWDGLGHMAVAFAAYERLTPATKNRVSALLKKNPEYHTWATAIPPGTPPKFRRRAFFMIAATWPDRIKHEPAYGDDGTNHGEHPDGPSSAQNTGYGDKLHHKYWHFVDTPFSDDGTALPPIPDSNAAERIQLFRGVLASNASDDLKSYDLVWLLHLVGDVHQPLHCTTRVSGEFPRGDAGGNEVKICNPGCSGELHAFWDDLAGSGSDVSIAEKVGKALPAPNATLASKSNAADWVQESFEAAKSHVYVAPIGAGRGPFTITSAYRSASRRIAKKRIALAAARLADLLNAELK